MNKYIKYLLPSNQLKAIGYSIEHDQTNSVPYKNFPI